MVENGKKLNELRVCDLKTELEKRKLDTVGAKATLVERLEKALKDEGVDPGKYVFSSTGDRKKSLDTPTKKTATTAITTSPEPKVIKEEPIEYTEREEEGEDQERNGDYEIDQVGDVDDECIIIEDEIEEAEVPDEEEYEMEEEYELGEEQHENDNGANEDIDGEDADANNHDNDESINLTIGEDEQKLLHDEAPDDKEKPVELNVSSKEKTAATKEKITEKVNTAKKDEKKPIGTSNGNNTKEKEKEKETNISSIKTKGKDDKHTGEKKETSDGKSSTSSTKNTTQKDDKEKSTANKAAPQSSSTTAGNAVASGTTTTTPTPATATSNNTNNSSGKTATTSSTTTTTTTTTTSSGSSKSAAASRNLWVSGLAAITRASDLKTIFSKYGKVIGAKVVTNTRTPGTRCYGYVTMSSSADASRCINHLHRTELHGRIISVERTKNEIGGSSATTNAPGGAKDGVKLEPKRREDDKSKGTGGGSGRDRRDSRNRDDKRKATVSESSGGNRKQEDGGASKDRKRERDEKDDRSKPLRDQAGKNIRSRSQHRPQGIGGPPHRPRIMNTSRDQRDRVRQREILTYQKIREERERQRLRERERELREEERRRREIRDRQRQEEARLAEERRKLAQERERLEREKAELLRLERERQKLEREKLELERLELKRQQMKIIQSRDDPINKPRHGKRSSTDRYAEAPERKRPAAVDSRFEAPPPPPRFDSSLVVPRGSKRDDYVSSSSGGKRHDSHDYGAVSSASKPRGSDYGTNGGASKRSAIDDYTVSAKRNSSNDYIKRASGGADYVSTSSKRGITNHRDDYSNKAPSRDDYKREAEIRHIPVATSGGGGGSGGPYHKNSNSGRYGDTERSTNPSSYRRGGMDEIRSSVTVGKRYDTSNSGYGGTTSSSGTNGGSSNIWNSSSGHGGNSGASTLKSYVGNAMSSAGMHVGGASWQKPMSMDDASWRAVPSSQDRYDRTYNERSSGYQASSSSNLYGSNNGRSVPDRYGGPMSRY